MNATKKLSRNVVRNLQDRISTDGKMVPWILRNGGEEFGVDEVNFVGFGRDANLHVVSEGRTLQFLLRQCRIRQGTAASEFV